MSAQTHMRSCWLPLPSSSSCDLCTHRATSGCTRSMVCIGTQVNAQRSACGHTTGHAHSERSPQKFLQKGTFSILAICFG